MTRDGTFVIRDGEIAHAAKSLRFTQSYVEALNTVEAIGTTPRLLRSAFGGATSVPVLKLGSSGLPARRLTDGPATNPFTEQFLRWVSGKIFTQPTVGNMRQLPPPDPAPWTVRGRYRLSSPPAARPRG
jgi:hypothetical protein